MGAYIAIGFICFVVGVVVGFGLTLMAIAIHFKD
jgi:hypothetical protein